MTGSGTQESPYIVTTWDEFLSVCNVSTSTYVEWNNGEVDFNEIQPTGFADPIVIKSNIKLVNVKWKNFVSTAKIGFKIDASATIIDLDGFELTDAQFFHPSSSSAFDGAVFSSGRTSYYGRYTIKNCVFSYRQDSAGKGGFIKYALSTTITSTAQTIKAICTGEYNFGDNKISYSECNIKLDIQAASLTGCLKSFLCWYSGKIQTSASSWTSSTVAPPGNSVFDVECNVPISFSNGHMYRCVFNSDKCAITGANWIGATTAQLSDTNYLYNQGLPVARDSS